MEGLIYFEDGVEIAKSGDAVVYLMNNELFLEIGPGRNLWALESEYSDYIEQLWDLPKGSCLEIGLGLGIASRCILSNPNVRSLTTIEKNKDIVAIQSQLTTILGDSTRSSRWSYDQNKHKVLNCEGLVYLYETKRKYDFIFLDFYEAINEETLPAIRDMVKASEKVLSNTGCILCWFDKYTPDQYVDEFFALFRTYLQPGHLDRKVNGF